MANYPKSFATSNFTLQADGRYSVTILASTHGLGSSYSVTKVLRRKDDLSWENMIPNYEILSNGDFVLYVDEPGVCKVYLMED